MAYQKLFEALQNVCGFTALESDMFEIIDAYEKDKAEQLPQADVSGRSEQLVNFLLHLNDKELINNHDFDYEKEAKKYLKKIN
jgi:hypothetical protein